MTALGDPTSLDLLIALRGAERDAHGLVLATGLAQSSIYRKLRELQAAGLVYVPRLAFNEEGRKIEVFRARWRVIRVELNDGRLSVERLPWGDAAGRLGELWEDVRTYGR